MTGHRFSEGDKKSLCDEERQRKQPARAIVDRMNPSPDEVVADLGCGPGYVTIPMAERVRAVYGVDVQQGMLDALMANLPEGLRGKVTLVLGELPWIPLSDRSIDRAVLVNVVHEVDDLARLDNELRRSLREGGRLSVVDFPKRETSFGPPVHERMDEDEVVASLPSFRKLRGWSLPEFYQLELERR
jgi:ubiquinone/menaquinone biosynthesis C-methylase UbiE